MKLLFFGDFSYDYDHIAEDIRLIGDFARKKGADIIVNLEGAITDGTGGHVIKRGKRLKQSEKCIEALLAMGIKGVTLANNHIMDFSRKGLFDTIYALDSAGIRHTGAGKDLRKALKPMILSEGSETVAVFNFGWNIEETVYAGLLKSGCAPRKENVILKAIVDHSRKNPEHRIIAVLHWGFEYNPYPLPIDIELARKLCEIESVYAVIGHHSHCPQPFEIINGKPVFYSLGNFYFSSGRRMFSEKRFDLDTPDLCSYSIGAYLDTSENKAEPLIFYYDAEKDMTEYREDLSLPVSMPEADYRSEEYINTVRSKSLRKNPIPGIDRWENRISFFKYNLRRNLNTHLGLRI